MRMRIFTLVAALMVAGLFPAFAKGAGYEPPQPSQDVAVVRDTWHDAARNRDVPVKIYYPAKGAGPFPVIIFSHGLGGSREGYEYLGRYWAGCGYVSVHLQHLGSDTAVWLSPGGPAAAIKDLKNAVDRVKDVPFAIDQLTALNAAKGAALFGKMDLGEIGISGHSFGGFTTTAVAGEDFGPGLPSGADLRIKAGVAMSAPVPPVGQREHAFEKITIPVFYMTGTLDDSPIGETKAGERRQPFDDTAHAESCLVIFKGADHMVFSGHIVPREADKAYQALICEGSVAFWDAYLKGDKEAKEWLYNGSFTKALGETGTFEKKGVK